ncbi:unnamed protein product [Malus baccata var. baccata]
MVGSSGADLRAPVFNGENFDFWHIKMKTIFRSHDLWDMVEKGYSPSTKREEELTATELKHLKENIVNDAKALRIIQEAVSNEIFPRIAILETAKSYGEDIGNQIIVQKLLISLSRSYDSIVAVIENTRDLETVDVQDVVATLKRYEQRIERHSESSTEKAFASLMENTPTMFYVCMTSVVKKNEDTWYIDNGCSNHMTGREYLLVNIDKSVTAKVEMGTGQLVNVVGKGELMVETKQGKRYIKEIMLVLGLKENLLSVGKMMEHGYYLVFGGIEVRIYDDFTCSNLVVKVPMKGNRSFPLKLQPRIQIVMKASVGQVVEIWHRRLEHLNMNALMKLQEHEMVTGLPELKVNTIVCEGYAFGKHSRDVFPKETKWRAALPLELIHTDICGPMQTPTKSGNKYFITFTDDCTRMGWVYFLRSKSEVFNVFKKFKATVELQSGYKLKKLRSDKGREYTSLEFS